MMLSLYLLKILLNFLLLFVMSVIKLCDSTRYCTFWESTVVGWYHIRKRTSCRRDVRPRRAGDLRARGARLGVVRILGGKLGAL